MDDIEPPSEPANLKFLRRLVTGLTATMILGVLTVIVLLVIRLNESSSPVPLPDQVTLPDGETATAFTIGSDWFAVVTQSDKILIYDQATGTLRQSINVTEAD